MPKIKIFFHPEAGSHFDENLPFVAFGEDCERTLEYLKSGVSIPIFYIPEEAARDTTKAALFMNGKLQRVGTLQDIYQLYGRLLQIKSERKDMIKVNAPIIEKLKKVELPFKIKNILVKDKEGNENYVFIEGDIQVEVVLENWEEKILILTLWKKETILEPSIKFLEIVGKVKNGKIEFIFDSDSLPEGEFLLKFFYKENNQIKEIKEAIEIRKRKLLLS